MPAQSVLSDTERVRALAEFIDDTRRMDFSESYLIAVLHKAQEVFGYLDRDVMVFVARAMRIPLSRVWGVATFYHYFNLTPRGKYTLSICMGTACYVKGAARVLQAIKERLGIEMGETTPDMMFTLLETRCLGACGLAPTMMINGRIFGELTPAKARAILERCREGRL